MHGHDHHASHPTTVLPDVKVVRPVGRFLDPGSGPSFLAARR